MDWTTACILWNLSRVSNRSLYGVQGTYFVLLWLVECGTHAFFLVQMLIDGLVGADLSYGTFHLTWRPADKKENVITEYCFKSLHMEYGDTWRSAAKCAIIARPSYYNGGTAKTRKAGRTEPPR